MRSCSRFESLACKFLRECFFMAFCQADEDDFHKLLENGYKIAVGTMLRSCSGVCYRAFSKSLDLSTSSVKVPD